MLVFGPYRALPKDESFSVFNLSSPVQAIPKLPGLYVLPNQVCTGVDEKSFDIWYYNYVLNDITACSSLLSILMELNSGRNVYICIMDLESTNVVSILNESFMKLIQARYDIKYSIINELEDFDYVPRDGCDFMSIIGIKNFDSDIEVFRKLIEEERLKTGGTINNYENDI